MPEPKPSKSELKRQDQALKSLGEEMIGLKPSDLDKLPLDERLREAIGLAQRIKAHGGLRRQRQLIGKLLRQADSDAIEAALVALRSDSVAEKRRFRDAEAWRDRLLDERHEALAECVTATGASEAELRDLLKQLARAKTPRADKTVRRELFRAIHNALEA